MDVPPPGASDAPPTSVAGPVAEGRASWQDAGIGTRLSAAFAARVDANTGAEHPSPVPTAEDGSWADLMVARGDLSDRIDDASRMAIRSELTQVVHHGMAPVTATTEAARAEAAVVATADAGHQATSWHRRAADQAIRIAASRSSAFDALATAYEDYATTVDQLTTRQGADAVDSGEVQRAAFDLSGRLGRAQEAFGTAVTDNAAESQRLLIDRFVHHTEAEAARSGVDRQSLSDAERPRWLAQDVSLERLAALGRDQVIEGRFRAAGQRLPRTPEVARELAGLARASAESERTGPVSTTFDPNAPIERADVFGRPENRYDINRLPGSALIPGEPTVTPEAPAADARTAGPSVPTPARARRPGPTRPRPARRGGTER